jgi:hypothetical protein
VILKTGRCALAYLQRLFDTVAGSRVPLADNPDSDAVMKNPFHTPEMPINSAQFDTRLQTLMATVNA